MVGEWRMIGKVVMAWAVVQWSASGYAAGLRAGASAVDITPRQWPVIVNGGFLEATADHADDPIYARSLVLEQGMARVVIAIVDSCMVPRELCDAIKDRVTQRTGIPRDKILIAATHAHSAPSVMDYCLGSRADPVYSAFLPEQVANSVVQAVDRLQPAQIAWTSVDATGYTHCRRWITRTDKPLTDPFGDASIRANMHPGHVSDDFTGPSGPVDSEVTIVSVRAATGEPLALLSNLSMHYFGGHPGVSGDYCGLFAQLMQERLAPQSKTFVAMMSQGTSGDAWWGDYSRPRVERTIDEYTRGLVDLVAQAILPLQYRDDVRLAMHEQRLVVARRTPDAKRRAWAETLLAGMAGRRPQNLPEVYAEQSQFLHEHPTTEVVVQAIQIGDFAITALPNEVYALTGLKLKARSPLPTTMNIELANGAAGYIPPPEQHRLGGYTTWPAQTAGLEVNAEPRLVEAALQSLESATGRPRRADAATLSRYGQAIVADRPYAYYPLEAWEGRVVADASGQGRAAILDGLCAYRLPGVPVADAQHAAAANHAIHLAGGRIDIPVPPTDALSLELWFWNGVPEQARPVTGQLMTWGDDEVRITGNASATPGRLEWRGSLGSTPLARYTWTHLVYVHRPEASQLYVNGTLWQNVTNDPHSRRSATLRIAEATDATPPFEGRLDEVSIYGEALSAETVRRHFELLVPARP